MKSQVLILVVAATLVSTGCVAAEKNSNAATDAPKMSPAEFATEMQRMIKVVRANDDLSTPGQEFHPGAVPPDYFKRGAESMLKGAGVSEKQITEMAKVNDELWALRVHDDDATAPEVARKVKDLIHRQHDILTPEQRMKVLDAMKARAMEARKQAEARQQQQGAGNK